MYISYYDDICKGILNPNYIFFFLATLARTLILNPSSSRKLNKSQKHVYVDFFSFLEQVSVSLASWGDHSFATITLTRLETAHRETSCRSPSWYHAPGWPLCLGHRTEGDLLAPSSAEHLRTHREQIAVLLQTFHPPDSNFTHYTAGEKLSQRNTMVIKATATCGVHIL